jgi:hypothetical protein
VQARIQLSPILNQSDKKIFLEFELLATAQYSVSALGYSFAIVRMKPDGSDAGLYRHRKTTEPLRVGWGVGQKQRF